MVCDPAEIDAHIAAMKKAFHQLPAQPDDKEWTKAKLHHMYDVDQYIRNRIVQEKPEEQAALVHRMKAIDNENTQDLKKIIAHWGWPTISSFGEAADNHAWCLVQHADDDYDFQVSCLDFLVDLYPRGETSAVHYAYLYDRVAMSYSDPARQQLQRYGTQVQIKEGKAETAPVEDPERLDERRKKVSLEPITDYLKRFSL